ncbi:TniB family NTP-binding protein [Bradyrhizobium valentinum]|uniref:TniB family NTP-binding protein n=1 Tax=Bradyrhizobium valentinum TaxID=1518501 RepID=UPI0007108329|nr:TniB family NTP-binding protein [Bradyrhizobium valentinum]KRR14420.1 transposase [Bradyrhizobium valentinum]
MSNSSYPHLLPQLQSLADAPAEIRIQRIRADRWIGYARAEAALAAMEDLLTFPKRTRMPNLLLVGPSNNGKTKIIEKFRRNHLRGAVGAVECAISVPVLNVQMPPAPDERRFFAAVLEALGAPDRNNERLATRQDMAMRMLRATDVRLLVIDEVHNILSGSRAQQRRFLNLLRWLGNELQIPLIAVGTAEALRAIQSDDQLANRFTPFSLPPWQHDAEYLRLLNTLEAMLPLRERSSLEDPPFAQKLLIAAEGILGEVVCLVTTAAAAAVAAGEERIRIERIDDIGFIPPRERRRVAS